MSALNNRRPFFFPGGMASVDTSHPVGYGKISRNFGCSFVCTGTNGLVSLMDGQVFTLSGSQVFKNHGVIGPCVGFLTTGAYAYLGNQSSASVSATTAAFIIVMSAYNVGGGGTGYMWSGGANVGLGINTSGAFLLYDSGNVNTGIIVPIGIPFFLAISFNTTAMYAVGTNLITGAVQFNKAGAGQPAWSATAQDFLVGTFTSQTPAYFGGYVAAGMVSQGTFLDWPQLMQWAADPWRFWYPGKNKLYRHINAAPPLGKPRSSIPMVIG